MVSVRAGLRVILGGGMGIALALAIPAAAQQIHASGDEELLLRNGQWAWLEDAVLQKAGGPAAVSILISLPGQIAYVYRDGVLIAASTVSTGKRGKSTPAGEFTILQKREFHRSNLYSNAPMPFMQRLTWTGIALHAGVLPGYPASHGCIRFPREFAREADAAVRGGITRQHPGVQCDPGPGQPLHERHRRVAVQVGAVEFALLKDRELARRGRFAALAGRDRGGCDQHPVAIDIGDLARQADQDRDRGRAACFLQYRVFKPGPLAVAQQQFLIARSVDLLGGGWDRKGKRDAHSAPQNHPQPCPHADHSPPRLTDG